MSRGSKLVRIISLVLLSAMLACLLTAFASADSRDSDFSRPASSGNTTLGASDFLTEILGFSLSDEERSYLDLYSDFYFSHASTVPISYVTASHDESEGILTVRAYEYSYTAKNGVEVTWIPESIECRGEEQKLQKIDTVYTAELADIYISDDNSVKVRYSSSFEISAEAVNSFLNLAYYDAARLNEEISEAEAKYTAQKNQYDIDKSSYLEYLSLLSEYEASLAIYREYQIAKRIYDENLAAYNTYLSELSEYEAESKRYTEYLSALEKYNADFAKYQAYLSFLEEYADKIEAYNIYVAKMETVRAQLAVLDSLKTPVTSLKRTVYSAIMGDTVTAVIANKDAITSDLVKADGAVVDLAGASTEKLRTLMTDYFSITDEAGKYSYYVAHYEEFRDNFVNLLRSLDKLYLVPRVRGVLIAQEKQEKYLILVAQLYYVANALSDTPVSNYDGNLYFNSSYYVGKGYIDEKKPHAILGGTYITDTNSAKPLEGGYPMPVTKPEYTPVEEPLKPETVKMPVKPDEVKAPGEPPTAVAEPTAPSAVEDPGEPPVPYTPPQGAVELVELYLDGGLELRPEYTDAITTERFATVNKHFYGANTVSVVYLNTDGSLLYRGEVNSGDAAEYGGPIPTKAEDASATYTFAAWVDADGTLQDLTSVSSDITVYPEFKTNYKSYNVTWNVDGRLYTESLTWGTVPEYYGTPVKEKTDSTYFVFDSWVDADGEPIAPVSGNVTYTAVFDELYFVPFEGGGASVTYADGMYTADCHGSVSSRFDISQLLALAAGEGGISIQTVSGTAVFSYSDTLTMQSEGVAEIYISYTQRGTTGYRYAVFLYDALGNQLSLPVRATFSASYGTLKLSHLVLYTEGDDGRVPIKYTQAEDKISFSVNISRYYYASVEYSVTVIPSELGEITVDKASSASGERVMLSYSYPEGVSFVRIYYIGESGEKITVNGSYLTMPAEDIMLGMEAYRNQYTVSFISDGKLILQYSCLHGDIPTPPSDPKKVSDANYSYTFTGWSSEISPVTENVEYIAIYSKTPIEKKANTGLQITPSVMKLLVLGASAVLIVALGIIPCAVITLTLIIKRKMSKISKKPPPRE